MIMLRRIFYHERDHDFRVKAFALEIGSDLECESVNCSDQRFTLRNKITSSTVGVRFLTSDRLPPAIIRLPIEPHHDASRRLSDRDIKDVCCYSRYHLNS